MTLPDDVVERVARSILVAIRTSNVERDALAWELTDEELAQIARAALEAARWGEMVECLQTIASQAICYGMRAEEGELRDWLKFISETAEQVLSTIGESNPDSGGV